MIRNDSKGVISDFPIYNAVFCFFLFNSIQSVQPITAHTMVSIPLGASVPALTPHAISVSLPTWQDNVGYEEGDKRVVDRMETGYPRFFIHRSIQKVCRARCKRSYNAFIALMLII